MRTVAIIQARMGSSRLPGKALQDLAGQPMLARVVERCRKARALNEVVVATTSESADEAIVRVCELRGWPHYRGSRDDVLDRYYRAAVRFQADVIVRVTSDCPLIEPELIDMVVDGLPGGHQMDYASNTLPPRTFPRGLDVEAMTFATLERAWREDRSPAQREHVTPYIYRRSDLFKLRSVTNDADYSGMRWTVDTVEDLAFVREVYKVLGGTEFSWREVLRLLEEHPEWLEINRHVTQKELG